MFGKYQCLENADLSQTAKLSYRGKESNVTGVNSAAMLSDVKLGLPALSKTQFDLFVLVVNLSFSQNVHGINSLTALRVFLHS